MTMGPPAGWPGSVHSIPASPSCPRPSAPNCVFLQFQPERRSGSKGPCRGGFRHRHFRVTRNRHSDNLTRSYSGTRTPWHPDPWVLRPKAGTRPQLSFRKDEPCTFGKSVNFLTNCKTGSSRLSCDVCSSSPSCRPSQPRLSPRNRPTPLTRKRPLLTSSKKRSPLFTPENRFKPGSSNRSPSAISRSA